MSKNPILLDIRSQIETERLILRVPRPGDGAAIFAAVQETLANLRPWMPWAQGAYTLESAEAFARQGAAAFVLRESMPLLVFRKADGRFLGGHGLTDHVSWEVPAFELGYWVRASEEGKGYISEATRAVTDFCFTTLRAERVEIRCDAANRRSAAVAERCGYTLEVRLRDYLRNPQGELFDMLVYAMLPDEWQEHRRS